MEVMVFCLVLYIVFAVVWCYQFIQLMLLEDSDFPGRFDKILWVAAFIGVFVVAPFAFVYWKQAYLAMRMEDEYPTKR